MLKPTFLALPWSCPSLKALKIVKNPNNSTTTSFSYILVLGLRHAHLLMRVKNTDGSLSNSMVFHFGGRSSPETNSLCNRCIPCTGAGRVHCPGDRMVLQLYWKPTISVIQMEYQPPGILHEVAFRSEP